MADTERHEHVNILTADTNLVNTGHMAQVSASLVTEAAEVGEDILQQAFQEASGPIVQEGAVVYANGQVVADGTNNGLTMDGTSVINTVKGTDVIYSLDNAASQNMAVTDSHNGVQDLHGLVDGQIVTTTIASSEGGFLQEIVGQDSGQQRQHAVVSGSTGSYVIRLQNQADVLQGGLVTVAASQDVLQSLQTPAQEDCLPRVEATQVNSQIPVSHNKTQTIIVQAPSASNTAPLGSSANPIRIVQQGNQYTSLQQLSAEQLSHIMQVVQQQQLMKEATESNKPSVVYNPQTQTHIIYKVMHPSELHNQHKLSKSSGTSNPGSSNTKNRPHQIYVPTESVLVTLSKRTYKKRKHNESEKVEAPELSKEEKEEKKKHRPRTRSGRISRPPRHMVKDYKHIHPVDWDEDYDDSDGGYSDFKGSSGDEDESSSRQRKKDSNYTAYTCLGPHGKAKPWKCKICEKAYIGKAGLARHYRLNPEHGKDDENFKEGFYVNGTDDGSSRDSATDAADGKKVPSQTGSQDQDGLPTSFANCTVTNTNTTTSAITNSTPTQASGPTSANKNLPKHKQENAPAKKKARLKEYIREFSDEDLMETVFPRLSQVVSTWEFMLMKAERGNPARPQLVHLLQEYVQIYRKIRPMCDNQLQLVPPGSAPTTNTKIQVTDEKLASALGLSVGLYSVQTKPSKEETFHYKLLTADPSTCNTPSEKRTLETVSAEDLTEGKPAKPNQSKSVMNQNKTTEQSAVLPGQTMSKPSLLSTVDAHSKTSLANGSLADEKMNMDTISVSNAQTPKPDLTGSTHQVAPQQSQLNATSSGSDQDVGSHDFNVVITSSDSNLVQDSVVTSAIMDNQTFMERHSSTSPVFSVCFVSTSSVTPSTVTDAVAVHSEKSDSLSVTKQTPETVEQLMDQSDMISVHAQEFDKSENHLLHESAQLLQSSGQSLNQSGELLEQSSQHEGQSEELMDQVEQSLPQSEQLLEQSNQQVDQQEQLMAQQEQSLQQSEHLMENSEQLENQQEQLMEDSEQLEDQQDQLMEQSEEMIQQPVQLMEHTAEELMKNESQLMEQTEELTENTSDMAERSVQLAGQLQLDATQLAADVAMSLPGSSMSYSSQYVDGDMSQHLVSDGMILTDQTNGQVLLEENVPGNGLVLTEQHVDQSVDAGIQDLNADNRLILIKNPDGSIQVHRQGNQPISLEDLQALLGIELDASSMTTEPSDQVLQ